MVWEHHLARVMKKWGRNKGVAYFYVVYTNRQMWRKCDVSRMI